MAQPPTRASKHTHTQLIHLTKKNARMEIHVEAANADMLPKGCNVSGFNLLTGFWRVARLRSSRYTYWGIDFFIKVYEIDFQVLDGKLSLLLLADWTTYRIFFRAQDPWQTKILGEYLWAFYIGYNFAGRKVRQNFPWRFWQRDSCALDRVGTSWYSNDVDARSELTSLVEKSMFLPADWKPRSRNACFFRKGWGGGGV